MRNQLMHCLLESYLCSVSTAMRVPLLSWASHLTAHFKTLCLYSGSMHCQGSVINIIDTLML